MDRSDYKILFISFYNGEAYGVRLLHSILSHKGYDTRMLFFKTDTYSAKKESAYRNALKLLYEGHSKNEVTDKEVDLLVNYISEYKPHILAFSLLSPNFVFYKKIYNRIRGLGEFKIVLGGWQVSLNPSECIDYGDILCIGEGDEALPELVDRMFSSQPIDDIKNLWIKNGDSVIKNKVRPLVTDFELHPAPIFAGNKSCHIEGNQLYLYDPYADNTRYGIVAGRGCPYTCTYCSNVYMAQKVYGRKNWSKCRYRTARHVLNELIKVKSELRGVKKINFYDEIFCPDKAWSEEFFDRYKKEINLPFYCMFYPGTCAEERVKVMKNAMLDGVWLGVQSGSERVRKEVFKRYYSNEDIINQTHIFYRHEISVRYDFIMNNPFETFEEGLESIRLMLELPQPFSVNLFNLRYFPKTEITEMALLSGLIDEDKIEDRCEIYQNTYGVMLSEDDSERNFINQLATYISFLAPEARIKKNDIEGIVDNYMVNRSTKLIRETLKSSLSR